MACIVVDVDGTLFDHPSTESRFIWYLVRHRRIGLRQLAASLWFFLRWGFRFRRDTARKNKAYLAGLPCEDVERWAEAFVRQELVDQIRPALLQRLDDHRSKGDQITLLTGTPDFIAAPLAAHLGVRSWSATRCVRRNGRFTTEPPSEHPLGQAKLDLARELCRAVGASLESSSAYADSIHDLPLLRAVHQPVAVQPDKKLAEAARTAGWDLIWTEPLNARGHLQDESSAP